MRRQVFLAWVLCCFASLHLQSAGVRLSGRVVDENEAPVRDARVTVRPSSNPLAAGWQAQTGPTGDFALALPQPGDYLMDAEREGYYALKNRPVHVEAAQEIILTLNSVREVFQSENVNAETSPLELAATQNQQTLTGTEVNNIPYANSHSLRNALQLLPDIIQDPAGALHVNGAAENQVQYVLNGFNLTNPISGQFQTLLAVEGIRSIDLSSARYSPELGKGAAGVLAINTENGTDALHYTTTDFIPGLDVQQGVRLGNWYPRFGITGPILRKRAWFADTVDFEYTQSFVTGLPEGQNTRNGFAGSNLLHTQINLTPGNILYTDFLVNADNEGRVGLGPLNPVSTTSQIDTREYFGSAKDQIYLGRGVLLELGYAHNNFSTAQTPEGQGLYIIAPSGNSGNYFVRSTQGAARDQAIANVFLPQLQFAGQHSFKTGLDADALSYTGDFRRTGYQIIGLSGELLSQTIFPAPAGFRVSDTELSWYLVDTWRPTRKLQVNLGIREDWDRRISRLAWSPRVSLSWSPLASGRTRISGGYAITHDVVTLDLLGRPLDQTAFTTTYTANGAPAGPPAPTAFAIPNTPLFLPRATNWNVNVDHQVSARVYLAAKYLRRRGTDEFAFVNVLDPNAPPSLLPVPNTTAAGVYQLTNLRRDDYDSVQFSIRQTFSGQYEWMASYTRSRALTNAVLDPNIAQPLQVLPTQVAMPWDAPNHFLAWAYLPLPRKNWAASILSNYRSGFPFSVREETGVVSGPVNSYRYPHTFDLNLAIERRITLRGYRFALRGGVDNLTNSRNPTAVNNVIGSPQYLQFFGYEGRHFVARIRFFGRATAK